ncbi:MAG: ATPase domain-containing protein, partial [Prochlorococcus sp.]
MQYPSAEGSSKMQVQKLPTGIEGFDDVCHGGLPTGRSTLVSGTSGTGKTVFSLHFLHNGISQ